MRNLKFSLFGIFLMVMGCSDVLELKKSDVTKYTWLNPFILDANNLSGQHNIDLGTMSFTYEYEVSYSEMQYNIINVINKHSWEMVSKTNNSWVIKKQIETYQGVYEETRILINLDSAKSLAIFEVR